MEIILEDSHVNETDKKKSDDKLLDTVQVGLYIFLILLFPITILFYFVNREIYLAFPAFYVMSILLFLFFKFNLDGKSDDVAGELIIWILAIVILGVYYVIGYIYIKLFRKENSFLCLNHSLLYHLEMECVPLGCRRFWGFYNPKRIDQDF